MTIGNGGAGLVGRRLRQGPVQPPAGDLPGRRHALRRRHREPRHPRRRPEGEDREHRRRQRQAVASPRRAAGRRTKTGLNSPWDLVQVPGTPDALDRDGRPAPDLAVRPRPESRRRLGRHRHGEHPRRPDRRGRLRPAERPGHRRQASSSSPTPRSRASAPSTSTGLTRPSRSPVPTTARRPEPLRVRRRRRPRAARSGSSTAWASPTATASSTSPTPTTTRSRSSTWPAATVKTLAGTRQAGQLDNPPQFYQPGGLSVPATASTSPTPTTTRSAS